VGQLLADAAGELAEQGLAAEGRHGDVAAAAMESGRAAGSIQ